MLSRRDTILTSLKAMTGVAVTALSPLGTLLASPVRAQGGGQADGVPYGAAVRDAPLASEPDYRAALVRHCRQLVGEGGLKWYDLRPSRERFVYDLPDKQIDFASRNGMTLRGHTLVWYGAMPDWTKSIASASEAEREMVGHIETVMGRYRGRIKSWDVINEAIDPATGNVRTNILHTAVGGDTSILDLAFRTARAELPTAELVYNDYMDWGATTHRNGVLNLLRGFRDRGVPVDALGIQSHIGFYSSGTAQDIANAQIPAMRAFLDQVVALGYKLIITEFDVSDRNRTGTVAQRDEDVAVYGRAWLDLLFSYPQLKDVLVWGMNDKYSWLQNFGTPRPDGQPLRPLPYDASAQPKRLYTAIGDAFAATTTRPVPT